MKPNQITEKGRVEVNEASSILTSIDNIKLQSCITWVYNLLHTRALLEGSSNSESITHMLSHPNMQSFHSSVCQVAVHW